MCPWDSLSISRRQASQVKKVVEQDYFLNLKSSNNLTLSTWDYCLITWNPHWGGRLSKVDLLVQIACFVMKKKKYIHFQYEKLLIWTGQYIVNRTDPSPSVGIPCSQIWQVFKYLTQIVKCLTLVIFLRHRKIESCVLSQWKTCLYSWGILKIDPNAKMILCLSHLKGTYLKSRNIGSLIQLFSPLAIETISRACAIKHYEFVMYWFCRKLTFFP